jgi:hypothetical protein
MKNARRLVEWFGNELLLKRFQPFRSIIKVDIKSWAYFLKNIPLLASPPKGRISIVEVEEVVVAVIW